MTRACISWIIKAARNLKGCCGWSGPNFVLKLMHNVQNERQKTQNLNMYENGLKEQRVYRRKSSRVCGEVVVVPSNVVPSLGFVREDFILVIITLSMLLKAGSDPPTEICVCAFYFSIVSTVTSLLEVNHHCGWLASHSCLGPKIPSPCTWI